MSTPEEKRPEADALTGQGGAANVDNFFQHRVKVAEIILTTVTERGVDPNKAMVLCEVVINEPDKKDDSSEEYDPEIELRELLIKHAELVAKGYFKDHPEEDQAYKEMIEQLKEIRHERKCSDYCFIRVSLLTEVFNTESLKDISEIMGTGLKIGVYDSDILFSQDILATTIEEDQKIWIRTTYEQIEEAKLFDVNIRGGNISESL